MLRPLRYNREDGEAEGPAIRDDSLQAAEVKAHLKAADARPGLVAVGQPVALLSLAR